MAIETKMDPIGDQLNIDTPELVAIEMPLAGIGSRFIAILVDYLIWGAAFVLIIAMGAIIIPAVHFLGRVSANWAIGIFVLIVFLLQWGYFALFEAFGNGRTPGKRVAKIRVIHQSGRGISFIESLARNLVRFVDYLPGFYAVGVVAIFVSRRHQRLGDMVAGTLVVRDRLIEPPHWSGASSRTITGPAFAPAADTSPMAAPHLKVALPAPALAKLAASDLESAGRLLCAPARHGPGHARRPCRTHRLGPLGQVGADDPAGYERGNLSGSCRASVAGVGADELRQMKDRARDILRFSKHRNAICASRRRGSGRYF